ncbi:MAG: hypothetical protein J6X55_04055 [Victivallales bacterium]|nr:hypothetical protein [Victivallales bacterium]
MGIPVKDSIPFIPFLSDAGEPGVTHYELPGPSRQTTDVRWGVVTTTVEGVRQVPCLHHGGHSDVGKDPSEPLSHNHFTS